MRSFPGHKVLHTGLIGGTRRRLKLDLKTGVADLKPDRSNSRPKWHHWRNPRLEG
jgi:hypothetical protein